MNNCATTCEFRIFLFAFPISPRTWIVRQKALSLSAKNVTNIINHIKLNGNEKNIPTIEHQTQKQARVS
jgi:hypothetical protein